MTRAYDMTKPSGAPFPVRDHPPREWFTAPTFLGEDEGWVILDNGRVAGRLFDHHLATTLADRRDRDGRPVTAAFVPAPSVTDFAAFHVGRVVCSDGRDLAVGSVDIGHRPNPLERRRAVARAGVDDRGVWVAGTLTPKPTPDPLRFGGDQWTVADITAMRACGISGDWRTMAPEWWVAHGHQAGLAETTEELVRVAIVSHRGNPLPGKGRPARRLTQTAALTLADDERSAALAHVLKCAENVAQAQERARVASVKVVRPDPQAWRQRARLAAVSLRAGRPFNPGPEGLPERLALLTAEKRVRLEQAQLDRALDRLQEADRSTSLQLIDATPPPRMPRPVARLTVAR